MHLPQRRLGAAGFQLRRVDAGQPPRLATHGDRVAVVHRCDRASDALLAYADAAMGVARCRHKTRTVPAAACRQNHRNNE